jgi:hypothetical protein
MKRRKFLAAASASASALPLLALRYTAPTTAPGSATVDKSPLGSEGDRAAHLCLIRSACVANPRSPR